MVQPTPPHRPSIVQITCHDLGRHLNCYGATSVRSPHLDALAAQGVRFTQAFCSSPGCSPSRSSLATGRYPHANGVMGLAHDGFGWDLNPDEHHIATLLRDQGYDTHLFGLQHVTMHPDRLGFTHIHRRDLGPVVATEVEVVLANADRARPFYLEINLEEPHRPYDQGGVQPDDRAGVVVPPWLPDTPASRAEFAELQGAIHAADNAIGRILNALDRSGLAESTFVLFTADHGLAMPRAKCTLYDTGIGVSLIVRWPDGGLEAGITHASLVSNVDVVPTLLDAIGAPIPTNLHGRSLLPLLRGESSPVRDMVFAEKTFHSYYDPMRAIRTDRYKLIRSFDSGFAVDVPGDVQLGTIYRTELQRYVSSSRPDLELYDLVSDPLETHNLAGQPDYAQIQSDLDQRLWQCMADTNDPLLNGPIPSPAYRRAIAARPST